MTAHPTSPSPSPDSGLASQPSGVAPRQSDLASRETGLASQPSGLASRESDLVELVDDRGEFSGTATVLDAHEAPGMLHRAFSVFLRDSEGRVLLQQRAAVKTRFPLRWGNTCCGHPSPGEPVTVSAGRRLVEELGIEGVPLHEVGVYVYFAEDPVTGRVEREYDHVLLGDLPDGTEPRPDPEEVAELRWVTVTELLTDLGATPATYAPWLEGVTRRLAAHLDRRTPAAGHPPAQPAAERSGGK